VEPAVSPAQKKQHGIILLRISPTALLTSYDFSFPLDMPSFIYYSIFIHGWVFFFYCWPAFTSSLTLLTLASI